MTPLNQVSWMYSSAVDLNSWDKFYSNWQKVEKNGVQVSEMNMEDQFLILRSYETFCLDLNDLQKIHQSLSEKKIWTLCFYILSTARAHCKTVPGSKCQIYCRKVVQGTFWYLCKAQGWSMEMQFEIDGLDLIQNTNSHRKGACWLTWVTAEKGNIEIWWLLMINRSYSVRACGV